MAKESTITLPCFGIVVNLTGDGGGAISSDLHEDCGPLFEESVFGHNAAMDGLESLTLAHAVAGIDISSPAYIEGIETAVQAIGNEYSYDDDDN